MVFSQTHCFFQRILYILILCIKTSIILGIFMISDLTEIGGSVTRRQLIFSQEKVEGNVR